MNQTSCRIWAKYNYYTQNTCSARPDGYLKDSEGADLVFNNYQRAAEFIKRKEAVAFQLLAEGEFARPLYKIVE